MKGERNSTTKKKQWAKRGTTGKRVRLNIKIMGGEGVQQYQERKSQRENRGNDGRSNADANEQVGVIPREGGHAWGHLKVSKEKPHERAHPENSNQKKKEKGKGGVHSKGVDRYSESRAPRKAYKKVRMRNQSGGRDKGARRI